VGVSRSAATSDAPTWLISIELSRSRSSPGVDPRQVEPRGAVAEAAEVDPREHHLAMALLDATTNLGEDGFCAAAA
jgi:hypothetical protein